MYLNFLLGFFVKKGQITCLFFFVFFFALNSLNEKIQFFRF